MLIDGATGLCKNKSFDMDEGDRWDLDEVHSVLLTRNDRQQTNGRSQPNRKIYSCTTPSTRLRSILKLPCLFFLLALAISFPIRSYGENVTTHDEQSVTGLVSLFFPNNTVAPGTEVDGLIEFSMNPGWHLYWKNPGETGIAPSFDWQLPEGITVKSVLWPAPSKIKRSGTSFYGYEGHPTWKIRLSIDKKMAEGTYPITLSAYWLACNDSCVPASQQVQTAFIVSATAAPAITNAPELEAASSSLPIDLQEASGHIEKNTLTLKIPILSTEAIQDVVIFPEIQKIIPLEAKPTWKESDNFLCLRIKCSKEGIESLLNTKRFEGLVQLIFADNRKITYAINAPVNATSPINKAIENTWKIPNIEKGQKFLEANKALYVVLLVAFLGGILLNLTPCVLPVVGLKVLQLITYRDIKRPFTHGICFTFGVLVSFWILAGGMYLFANLGTSLGWGFQLQEPLFVASLIIILFSLALSLFGLFEMGLGVASWAARENPSQKDPSYLSSFASGLLATLVATPCTGPLLGSVLGFAVTLDPDEGYLLFTSIGLGISFPFLVISAFPSLVRWLPRPGAWMVTLKQFFGFCVLATIVWLLWVLSFEVTSLSISLVATSFFLLAAALWILGRWGSPQRMGITRFIAKIIFIIMYLGGAACLLLSFPSKILPMVEQSIPTYKSIQWKPFSKEQLTKDVSEGRVVFVEFTAKWCLICQTNKIAFFAPEVINAFDNVIALRADWTNGDPEITNMMRSLGRNGVPVYAIFRAGEEPIILPEIVTPDMICRAIEKAQKR